MSASYEGLRVNEVEKMKFAFQIYETSPDKMDSLMLGDLLRAVNINPSLERMKAFGIGKKAGEKTFNTDECLKIYSELKKEVKDMGCYEDFIECLKLYDKAENGKMLLGELQHSLLSLGEKLSDDQVEKLFDDCMGEENDEGEIDYVLSFSAQIT
ncbi:PREDICTED: myosin light chain alkali-like isoform X2 [Nicrophorus vespilloides]|uniref:Myosin light chain alkali-like isoform X2 n=1 Tax=Nicrophorus vespilloides TaxID=110193 RepID=A0ABM1MY55_NICVS|nr:PREDICTED: myosin light chain alkali-like isoform X2 [Nicrophorus vespilloides]XP_017779505.1 PREDICTED: myosin light chain alkali-like isoform X2 [Nicrophorus vespilloides]